MKVDLKGLTLAVLGGDERELVYVPNLIGSNAKVNIVGFDNCKPIKRANHYSSIDKAIDDVDAVIMPMPGTDTEGRIRAIYSKNKFYFTENTAAKLSGIPIFIGVAKPIIKRLCFNYSIPLIEIAELDEIAILNSIPTAEGALLIAMEETPFTIHNSNCFVLGYGRIGVTLANTLKSLGANTFAAARSSKDLARIYEQNLNAVEFSRLGDSISKADIIFNTVPSMVLDENILKNIKKNTIIIDLASAPGGTDFQTAEKLGIKAVLAPGLPGKVAPLTAGKILARVLPKLICENLRV
ncbi:MAG: dipicolinate synthase subunit DpsA [Clostridia bacterium]|nr:dipicolinate synthase subunit DpsA [Clostridia bacterium]